MTMATEVRPEIGDRLATKIGDGWVDITVLAVDERGLLVRSGSGGQFRILREDEGGLREAGSLPANGAQPAIPGMMNIGEAAQVVALIKDHLDGVRNHTAQGRRLLAELEEKQGWRALGYRSFRACVKIEFGIAHPELYRELAAAEVERNAGVEIGTLRESQARALKALPASEQKAVLAEVTENGGTPTAVRLREAIERRRAVEQPPIPAAVRPPGEVFDPAPPEPVRPPRQEPARRAATARQAQPPPPAPASGEGEGASRQAAGRGEMLSPSASDCLEVAREAALSEVLTELNDLRLENEGLRAHVALLLEDGNHAHDAWLAKFGMDAGSVLARFVTACQGKGWGPEQALKLLERKSAK